MPERAVGTRKTTIPAPRESWSNSLRQFTCRIPEPVFAKLTELATAQGKPVNAILADLLARALAERQIPDPSALIGAAEAEAQEAARQVFGEVDAEIEDLRSALSKIDSRLAEIDSEMATAAREGALERIRSLAEESARIKAEKSKLQAQIKRMESRKAERDAYARRAFQNALRKRIAEIEPLLKAELKRLAALLDVATPLLERIPAYQTWRIGLVYWILALLAEGIRDEHLKNLLRRQTPIAFKPKPLGELLRS